MNILRNAFAQTKLDPEYLALTPKIVRFFESILLPSWWVFLYVLIGYIAYNHSVEKLNREYVRMRSHYEELKAEKAQALATQEDYLLKINSQSDQDWVELTLMKVLGLVPEEQVKVFFSE